jgi:hypothetical protein
MNYDLGWTRRGVERRHRPASETMASLLITLIVINSYTIITNLEMTKNSNNISTFVADLTKRPKSQGFRPEAATVVDEPTRR